MLCFNYIANIIKLMGLLSREGMRDGDIGICWDAGHIGICGDMWDMRDGPPPRNRPGRAAVFWTSPPPIHEERETGTANDLRVEKRMLILYLTC